jgi:hypothetical protein
MKRRSFLAFLGLAPAAPAIAKALPDFKPAAPVDGGHLLPDSLSERFRKEFVDSVVEIRRLGARLRYVDGRYSVHVPCEFGVDAGGAYSINAIVFPAASKSVAVDGVEIFDVANGAPLMYDTFGTPLYLTADTNVCIEPGNFRVSLA